MKSANWAISPMLTCHTFHRRLATSRQATSGLLPSQTAAAPLRQQGGCQFSA